MDKDCEHRLLVDYRDGGFEGQCSCGGWQEERFPARLDRLREVYPRLMAEHRRHVAELDAFRPVTG